MIKIKSNVKLPPRNTNGGRKEKYPYSKMKIGDMFIYPKKSSSLHSANARHKPKKFVSRTLENGNIGCWRIK